MTSSVSGDAPTPPVRFAYACVLIAARYTVVVFYYSSVEKRERIRQFDTYIQAGLSVLANPNIAKNFAAVDLEYLRTSFDSAVLPNVRHKKISIPLSKLLLDSPIVVPASNELFPQTMALARRSLSIFSTARQYSGDIVHSKRYGRSFPRIDEEMPEPESPFQASIKNPSGAVRTMATTHVEHFLPRPGKEDDKYAITRPLVTFRTELLSHSNDYVASLAIHEAIHCQDYAEHGPVESLEYTVATELRAYQAGFAIAEEYEQTNDKVGIVRSIEQQRVKRQTAVGQYIVDQDLVTWMLERNLV